MNKNYSETDIVKGINNNDKQLFGYIFDKYYSPLCFFSNRFVNEWEEAHNIVTRVFLRLQNPGRVFESEEKIKAFLYVSTKLESLNFIMSRKLKPGNITDYDEQTENLAEPADFERQIIISEFINLIRLKAQELPRKCRDVFMLSYFEGYNTSEIARIMDIAESTVRSHKERALDLLRLALPKDPLLLAVFALVIEYCEN